MVITFPVAGFFLANTIVTRMAGTTSATDASAALPVVCWSAGSAPGAGCPRQPVTPQGTGPTHLHSTPAGTTHASTPGSPTASPSPSATRKSSPAPPAPQSSVTRVLKLINKARANAGLPPYTLTAALHRSASKHDTVMATGCGLSHQCPGEPSLGARESAAGVPWTAAGENIGEGGPVATSPAAVTQMALTLTQDMLNEKPPSDGHRRNILSSTFTHIGIAIERDSSGTVWITQDFSN